MKKLLSFFLLAVSVSFGQITSIPSGNSGLNSASITRLAGSFTSVFEGNSITAGNHVTPTTTFPYLCGSQTFFVGRSTPINVATSGAILADIVSEYSTQIHPYRQAVTGIPLLVSVEIGTNDYRNIDAATYLASLESYWATIKGDAASLVAFTVTGRTDDTLAQTVNRIAINAGIKSSPTPDVVIDMDAALPDHTNTTWYSDGTHPTAAANQIFAQTINEALLSIPRINPYGGANAGINSLSFYGIGQNLSFTGAAVRLYGDLSNVTIANRMMVQTSTADSSSTFAIIPSGSGVSAGWETMNNSGATNAGTVVFGINSTNGFINTTKRGSGTTLPFDLLVDGTAAFRLQTNSNVTVGSTTNNTLGKLQVTGGAGFYGNGSRLYADLSNSTVANRFIIQNSTTDAGSTLAIAPNGTSTSAGWEAMNNSGATNTGSVILAISNTAASVNSTSRGSGTALPLDLSISGTAAARVQTNANISIGSTTDNSNGKLQVTGGFIAGVLQSAGTATSCTGATIGTGSKANAGFVTATTTGVSTVVVTFPFTATTGWAISPSNNTTANLTRQSASSTTTATFTGTTVTGDVISYTAVAY